MFRRVCSCLIILVNADHFLCVSQDSSELIVCKSVKGVALEFKLPWQQRGHSPEIDRRMPLAYLFDHEFTLFLPVLKKVAEKGFAQLVTRAAGSASGIPGLPLNPPRRLFRNCFVIHSTSCSPPRLKVRDRL